MEQKTWLRRVVDEFAKSPVQVTGNVIGGIAAFIAIRGAWFPQINAGFSNEISSKTITPHAITHLPLLVLSWFTLFSVIAASISRAMRKSSWSAGSFGSLIVATIAGSVIISLCRSQGIISDHNHDNALRTVWIGLTLVFAAFNGDLVLDDARNMGRRVAGDDGEMEYFVAFIVLVALVPIWIFALSLTLNGASALL
ncbi:hypothetical protein [Sphingomonas sp. LR55]|uniref:hypothetical protein n=1 Tax=Sphingomonas sp. LR55 TaxID=3050231 RepID=UPI002FE3DF3D